MDFLRQKDFVRPLSSQQLQELRQNVQTSQLSGPPERAGTAATPGANSAGDPDALILAIRARGGPGSDDSEPSLITAGLGMLGDLLRKRFL